MKEDEIKFFRTMANCGRRMVIENGERVWIGDTPRFIINVLGEYINHKRCWYLLEKWSGLGFYNYGVSLDLGWLELDKLPDRYRELLNK